MSNSSRSASLQRKTAETDVALSLRIDGNGRAAIDTGIPFFNHMLALLARHSLFDLEIRARGDLEVDYHHTVEDVGIVLGRALSEALGEKRGILRYGWCLLPMDETLARVALDLGGRSYLVFRGPEKVEPVRDFSFQLVEEFLRAFASNALANLHVDICYGRDAHHMAEAVFKGLARCLDQACSADPRRTGDLPTTKESW
ncbi:MAG TPA: imidazoleglycerol-phosphate dehydratase HisB [Verrucomicrobiales bacterium]|nr:imidazoleglycerol-phosphate dehydratase HisB [Verrucomicrobiales bacterium]